jgi:hypothetical protein
MVAWQLVAGHDDGAACAAPSVARVSSQLDDADEEEDALLRSQT